ncbi:protein of unknown function DUF935 [Solidesulfovibrio carbinoliphilus subsp. oakridgensis]|uniref:Mu-like prophage protein gp29 n=1 Tax=Solidesulfovibrio carbinoliphilus subsp. oakridgensis TaxID=694327 RepID=G7QD39_9BACT|nr:DUF935 family protein [Solidesulfovibrio carbinoliphilus]EHJ46345.1 protein of unknown function DUF935 [Solidesulfovibrio carbinoliphilus subsp. oakridgensis]
MEFGTRPLAELLGEVAVPPASWGLLGLLPDPDPVLRSRGDDARVLEELTADGKVCSSIQGRKIKTLNKRQYRFEPGKVEGQEPTAEAKRLCDDLTRDLERVDLLNLFSQVLDAPYYGFTPTEILWRAEPCRMRVRDLVPKPREWFVFDVDGALCFRGEDAVAGDKVHPFKMVLSRHFPTYKNPYGLRLLSRCLFPVAFKRGGIEFLMRFAEKFGMPWVVGKARPGSTPEERRDMAASLSAMVRDAVAVVSGGAEVQIETVEGKATGGIHLSIVNYMDGAIAQILQGQTLTQEIGAKGSYAAANTHYNVLSDYAEADQTLVVTAMNDLAWIYGQVNAPDVLTPVFSYVEPEDLEKKATLGKKLYDIGARFKRAYFEGFGLAPDEFTVVDQTARPSAGAGEAAALAAGQAGFTPDPQAVERLVTEALQEGGRAVRDQAGRIVALMERAESWEDAELLLIEAFPDLDGGDFQKAVAAAQVAADLLGRYAVRLETGRAG